MNRGLRPLSKVGLEKLVGLAQSSSRKDYIPVVDTQEKNRIKILIDTGVAELSCQRKAKEKMSANLISQKEDINQLIM